MQVEEDIDRVTIWIILYDLLVASSYSEEWGHNHEEDLLGIEYEYKNQLVPIDVEVGGRCQRTEMITYIWMGDLTGRYLFII